MIVGFSRAFKVFKPFLKVLKGPCQATAATHRGLWDMNRLSNEAKMQAISRKCHQLAENNINNRFEPYIDGVNALRGVLKNPRTTYGFIRIDFASIGLSQTSETALFWWLERSLQIVMFAYGSLRTCFIVWRLVLRRCFEGKDKQSQETTMKRNTEAPTFELAPDSHFRQPLFCL